MGAFDDLVPQQEQAPPKPSPFADLIPRVSELNAMRPSPTIQADRGGQPLVGDVRRDPVTHTIPGDTGEPSFGLRAGASVKMTPEGVVGYLQHYYGPENVGLAQNGKLAVRNPQTGQWEMFREGMAGLTGPAINMIPFLAASPTMAGMAAAGAGGAALRQGASAMLPGEDYPQGGTSEAIQRGTDIAVSAGSAALFQGAVNQLTKAVEGVRPHNIVARQLQTPMGRKGARLSGQTGVDFTVGQQSGSQTLLKAEGIARQGPLGSDVFYRADQRALRQAVDYLDTVVGKLDPSRPGEIEVGTRVSGAFNKAVDAAVTVRRNNAAQAFGAARQAAGGRPIVSPQSLLAEVDKIIQEFDAPGAGDYAATIVSKAKALRADIARTLRNAETGRPLLVDYLGRDLGASEQAQIAASRMTVDEVQRLLQVYGNAAQGKGAVFADLESAQGRMLAKKLRNALLEDIGALEGQQGESAQALLAARARYKQDSEAIDALGKSVLGRLFNRNFPEDPEQLARVVLRMNPSSLRSTMDVLRKHDPSAVQAVKSLFLQRGLEAAVPRGSGQVPGAVQLSPARFDTYFYNPANTRTFNTLFTRREKAEILRGVHALTRLNYKSGMQGSQTGAFVLGAAVIRQALASVGSLATGHPLVAAKQGMDAFIGLATPYWIARAMTDPAGRQALMTVATVKPGTKKAIASATFLLEQLAREQMRNAREPQGMNLPRVPGP